MTVNVMLYRVYNNTILFVSAWLGALCLCVSFTTSPLIVAVCRRKSTRLAAVIGGLVMALACLFTSFAVKFHQALLSYGLVLGKRIDRYIMALIGTIISFSRIRSWHSERHIYDSLGPVFQKKTRIRGNGRASWNRCWNSAVFCFI